MSVQQIFHATPIGEVTEVNPKGPAKGELLSDSVVDFLPMADLQEDGSMQVSAQRRYEDVAKGYTAFRDGDVLLAKITPCFENNKIGLARVTTGWAFGSTEFHVLRPTDHLDARYLTHFLRQDSVRDKGEKRMTGSAGQRRVPIAFLEDLHIPLPPIDEQRRIAGILDQADALRRLRTRALEKLNTLGQAIFHEMFGGSQFQRLPLKSLGTVSTGSTPSTAIPEYFDGDIPFVTPGDLESDRLVARYLSEVGAEKSRTVAKGATLVCCIGATIGKMGVAKQMSAFNQQINAVEWGPAIVPEFGHLAMLGLKDQIQHLGKGGSTTLPILKKSSFEKLTIPVAPLPAQQAFAEVFRQVQIPSGALKRSISEIETLFASLQHRAFRGEL